MQKYLRKKRKAGSIVLIIFTQTLLFSVITDYATGKGILCQILQFGCIVKLRCARGFILSATWCSE